MSNVNNPDRSSPPKPHIDGVGLGNGRRCSDDRVWAILLFSLDRCRSDLDRLVTDLDEEWSLRENDKASDAPTFQDLDMRIRSVVGTVEKSLRMLERLGPLDQQFDERLKQLENLRDEMRAARAEHKFEQQWPGRQFVDTWRSLCEPWRDFILALRLAAGSRIEQPLECARSSIGRGPQSYPDYRGEEGP